MSVVYCKAPRAGLGNQLFPIMKAFTFGYINNYPVKVFGYNQFKLGPYLRGEKTKRNYTGYFTFEKNIFLNYINKLKLLKLGKNEVLREPLLEVIKDSTAINCYFFSCIPHWSNYFNELKDYREVVIQLFYQLLTSKILRQIEDIRKPCISVHIRMGDYRKLKEGEDFKKVGLVRTPEVYFIDVIKEIRKLHGTEMPVSVFSDGYRSEFKELHLLKNIHFVEGNPDIVDLILISKSKIIVTSAGSTFSYWAGFLSNCPLIIHQDHVHESIRPSSLGQEIYEGPFDPNNKLLIKNIHAIV